MEWLNTGVGEEKRWFYPISAFFIGAGITVTGIWPMIYPYVQSYFGLETTASIVLAATFTNMGFMLLGPPMAGVILDKYGPKINYVISATLLVLGHFLVRFMLTKNQWSDAMYIWFLASLLVGLGIGFSTGTYQPTVGKWFPDKLGTTAGIVAAGGGSGTIIFSPLLASYVKANGFNGTIFIYLAAVAAISVLGLGFFWRTPPHDWLPSGMMQKAKGSGPRPGQVKDFTLPEAMKDKRFWILYACITCAAFSFMFLQQNVTLIIIEGLSHSMDRAEILATVVPTFITLAAVAGLAGRFFWGMITDKLGGPWKTLWMVYLLPAIWMALFYLGYKSKMLILINGFLFYCLAGGEPVVHMAVVPHVFGRRHLGKIMTTLFSLSAGIGMAIGPYMGAYIKDVTGGYFYALVIAVSIRLLGTLFALWGLSLSKQPKISPEVPISN